MAGKAKFYNYLQLMKSETNYGKRMTRLRNQIFGEVVRPTNIKSMKVVHMLSAEPIHKKEEVTHYYPRHRDTHSLVMALRDYGLFRDEHEDFKEEMVRQHILRGKRIYKPGEKKSK